MQHINSLNIIGQFSNGTVNAHLFQFIHNQTLVSTPFYIYDHQFSFFNLQQEHGTKKYKEAKNITEP